MNKKSIIGSNMQIASINNGPLPKYTGIEIASPMNFARNAAKVNGFMG